MRHAKEPTEWRRAQELAARVLTGEEQMDGLTQGAVGFHAISVQPNWGPQFVRTVEIGGHIFYRRAGRSHLRAAQI
jgi:spore germination cell wall hydrolase CwlJ-like protein